MATLAAAADPGEPRRRIAAGRTSVVEAKLKPAANQIATPLAAVGWRDGRFAGWLLGRGQHMSLPEWLAVYRGTASP